MLCPSWLYFIFFSDKVSILPGSLYSVFVSPYSVFMCCLSAASSAMFSIYFSSSAFIFLFTSLSFSAYFTFNCLLGLYESVPRNFLCISSLWSTRAHDSLLIYGFFFFLSALPRTASETSVYAFPHHLKITLQLFSPAGSSSSSTGYLLLRVFKMSFFQLGLFIFYNSNTFL